MNGDDKKKVAAEDATVETENWYKDLVDYSRNLVQLVDSEGRFIYVNQAWLSTLKYVADEASGLTLWEIIHPDSMEHCRFVFEQVVTGKSASEVKAFFIAKDGTPVAVEGSVSVKLDEKNKFIHTRGIFVNVTERKKAEEALQQRSTQVKAILDTVPSYIFAKDIDGRFLLANKAVAEVFGVEPEDVEGKTDLDYGASEEQMHLYNMIDRGVIESGESLLIPEEQIMRKDGNLGWFQTVKIPYSHPRWDKPAILGVATDITERKQAEEEIASTNKMLELVMNNIPQFIFWKDRNSVYLGCNENQAKVAGLSSPKEIVGKTDYDLPWKKEEADFFREGDQRVMDSGVGEYHIIEPQLQSDGKQAWLDTNKVPLLDKDGNVIGILGTYEDITERKQAEQDLRNSELRNRALVEAIPDLLFRFNSEGIYLDAAIKNEDLLHDKARLLYKKNALIGKSVHEVLPAVIAGKLTVGIEDALKSGKIQQTEYSYNLKDMEHHFEARMSAIGKTEVVAIVRDITERRQADEKIRYLSYHDQLTGLYNRHYLEEEMKRLDTERQLPISIIMADLNGLKLVNDTYGHQIGDEILQRAAEILKSVCREDDLLARFGGDEFVLYLPRTPEKEARKISERIEKSCRKELVHDVPLSISTGLAAKVSADQKLADLLKETEDNMYRDKLTESRSGKSAIVSSLLQTLAAKSYETETHTRNMQEAAKSIGEKLGLPHSELHRLQLIITLHDIGKINIPEELLTKRGSLTATEWEVMKKHTETGYRITKATDSFAHVAEDILAHHERWDGSGYPQGLKGEAIPILARITAIADAYEVMSNGRPYKQAMSRSDLVAELKKCSGTQFDPHLVAIFLSVLKAED